MQVSKIRLIALVILTLIVCVASEPQAAASSPATQGSENYVFRRSWGGEGDVFNDVGDVTVGLDGTIFVANSGLGRVVIISPGELIYTVIEPREYETGYLIDPTSVATDPWGNIYVLDDFGCHVVKFDSEGNYLTKWGDYNNTPGNFIFPKGIAADDFGYIYVADTANDRIQKFTTSGTYILEWGSDGSGEGQFDYATGLDVDSFGRVYVADSQNYRIQIFDANGNFLDQWGGGYGFGKPRDVVIDTNDKVYVLDTLWDRVVIYDTSGNFLAEWDTETTAGIGLDPAGNILTAGGSRVEKYTSDGRFLIAWGREKNEPGQFDLPYGLDIHTNGSVYVADSDNDRIQVFTSSGAFLHGWGTIGSDPGEFDTPRDVAFDSDGNVYTVEEGRNRVQVFSAAGDFITQWGSYGSDPGEFWQPFGISLDPSDNVYVFDTNNSRIQKFSSSGVYLGAWGTAENLRQGYGIAANGNDQVFIGDRLNSRILRYSDDGDFQTTWNVCGSPGNPGHVDIDANGDIFTTCHWFANHLQKFSPEGVLWADWSGRGSGPGEINNPIGIAVGPNGEVYIGDTENHRIQVFTDGYPTPDPSSGLVQNGNFEASPSLTEWTYGGDLPVSRTPLAVEGSYAISLGQNVSQGEQGQGTAWAHTTFYVPDSWERPLLSFKYNLFVNDIVDYSDFFVAVQDGVGHNHLATVLRDGYDPCIPGTPPNPGTELGWREAFFDLSDFKGQHIRLVFSNRNLWQNSWGIWTYVDDVRVLDVPFTLGQGTGPFTNYLSFSLNRYCDPAP